MGPSRRKPSDTRVYQLRIALEDIRPEIWRRVQVPAAVSLRKLHDVLQAAMGWTNSHLHGFEAGGRRFGRTDPELDAPAACPWSPRAVQSVAGPVAGQPTSCSPTGTRHGRGLLKFPKACLPV